MISLSKKQKKYIFLQQTTMGVLMNIIMNSLMGWVVFKSADKLNLWGENSFAFDLIMTTFMLVFMTSLLVSKMTHKAVKSGKLQPLEIEWFNSILKKSMQRPFLGSLLVAIVITLVFIPLLFLLLEVTNATLLSLKYYIIIKGSYAGFLALIFTPIVVIIAMCETKYLKK
ncbi:hypothetical protein CXF68_14310 [Tenacibaculum sp. Bg11-29]|uniref:hypothetical protein n=1 Tax=Tenacibaculum sp. Bg11-29 TaxID=2058306 RepID=UPI000C328E74|nr:hypothetical protein [Tenacibaculum sp. Bg11-29]PKH51785.1 hypothetical protein CXF68_14310 [Tenacibaculum sp. Bg11-29]